MQLSLVALTKLATPLGLGLFLWRIEDFLPVSIPEIEHGHLYEGDCYIALKNSEDAGTKAEAPR